MDNDKILQEEGEVILPITHESCVLNDDGQPLTRTIGNVSNLYTRERTLVGAINEVYAASLKQQMVEVLLDKGINCNINMTFVELLDLFRSINDVSGGGLDIIAATELPATGRENQICVITDNPVERFMLSNSSSDYIDDGSVINGIISYGANSSTVLYTLDSITTRYGFNKFTQEGSFLPSYIYQNGSWNQFTFDSTYIVQDMNHITDNVFGGLYNVQSSDTTINTPHISKEGLTYYCYTGGVLVFATTVNAVDVSTYNKIIIRASNAYGTTTTTVPRIAVYRSTTAETNFQTNSYNPPAYVSDKIMVTLPTGNMEYYEYEFDISNWDGTYNIGIMIDCVGSAALVHISDIYIY